MSAIVIIVLFIVGLLFYFLPTFIAQGKRNSGAIFVLNFFLGWTLIGWVCALVWACINDTPTQYVQIINNPGGDSLRKPSAIVGGAKICPTCQERNNPLFTQCWKCKQLFQ